MSEQPQLPNENNRPVDTPPLTSPTTDQDWRDMRRSEREARREERHERRAANGTPWLGGIILIVLGVIFLLQNFSQFHLNNWWALFILIPALGSFADAWNIYRQTGRLNRRVRGELISGCVFSLVTATFLFNWSWGVILPILLILWGVSLLLNSLLPE